MALSLQYLSTLYNLHSSSWVKNKREVTYTRSERYGMIWQVIEKYTTQLNGTFSEINALLHAWLICLNECQEKEKKKNQHKRECWGREQGQGVANQRNKNKMSNKCLVLLITCSQLFINQDFLEHLFSLS